MSLIVKKLFDRELEKSLMFKCRSLLGRTRWTNPLCVVLYSLLYISCYFLVRCGFVLHLVARFDLCMLLLLVIVLVIGCRWRLSRTYKFISVVLSLKFTTDFDKLIFIISHTRHIIFAIDCIFNWHKHDKIYRWHCLWFSWYFVSSDTKYIHAHSCIVRLIFFHMTLYT